MSSSSSSKPTVKPESDLSKALRHNERLKRKIADLKAQQKKEAEAKVRAEAKAKKEAERDKARESKAPKRESKEEKAPPPPSPPSKDEVKEAFDLFDTDKSGFIEWDEFQLLTAELGQGLSEREVKDAIATFDKDGDGKVSLDEFYAWYVDPTKAHGSKDATGAATAAIIQAKLLLFKSQGLLKRLKAAKIDIKESKSAHLHHAFSFALGSFGLPAAAITATAEFKHVADESWMRKCKTESDPFVYISVDIKMVAGKATNDEHKKFFESIINPFFEIPKLPRELRSLMVNVQVVGRDLVRITLMMPFPDTIREFESRKRERAQKARESGSSSSSSSGKSVEKSDTDKSVKLLVMEDKPRPTEKTPDDDADLREQNPWVIYDKLGLDLSKWIKKAQVRVETAHSWETVSTPPYLAVGDLLKARFSVDTLIDPGILQVIIEAAGAARGEELLDRHKREAANIHFAQFVKVASAAISIGDLTDFLYKGSKTGVAKCLEGDMPSDPAELKKKCEATLAENMEDGRLREVSKCYLVGGDVRRFLRYFINNSANRRSYGWDDKAAMLMVAKMFSTLLAKDIEEVTAVHVRGPPGVGISVALDRVLLFPAISDILAGFNLDLKSREIRERGRGY